jgi:hypothetical protein
MADEQLSLGAGTDTPVMVPEPTDAERQEQYRLRQAGEEWKREREEGFKLDVERRAWAIDARERVRRARLTPAEQRLEAIASANADSATNDNE